ncbi:phosphatidate cytidylyltransferase [Fodinibius salsisoli]|uniref:Phosphatidate cytidylyltransferase n=1 Tax=Fodinibius salsisoli TaxID=2820877 RepID=A0ABT3PRV0_9BACT|nr:phosphatidate cytidylyltransferase [Fodinibius salsisoli]
MSELTKRILFAVPAAALFLYITYLGGLFFAALITLITLFVQKELLVILQNAGFKADSYFPYLIGLCIVGASVVPHAPAIVLALFLLFIGIQIFRVGGQELRSLIATFFCSIYAPAGFLMLILIRETGAAETGFVLTLSLLLMVWGNDVFAYFGGKSLGKNKLAPSVSPNKTWEGFFFGVLGAFVGLLIVYYLVPLTYPAVWWQMLPAVVLVSIFGPIGDLTESRLKRAANVKDASSILPGHGGFFDRFDALILAAPAFYLYIYWLQISGYASF